MQQRRIRVTAFQVAAHLQDVDVDIAGFDSHCNVLYGPCRSMAQEFIAPE